MVSQKVIWEERQRQSAKKIAFDSDSEFQNFREKQWFS